MARPKGQSDARERLLAAAGRGFRTGGYGGIGVDGLAKEAGLTSGAFYAHFGSKADAFRLALVDGLAFLLAGIDRFRAAHGPAWLPAFVDFYFLDRLAVPLSEACALPSFLGDAARADEPTRAAYEEEIGRLVAALAEGLGGPDARARALHLMALMAGGAGLARAVPAGPLRAEIVEAMRQAARAV